VFRGIEPNKAGGYASARTPRGPYLSVIVPVHEGAEFLPRSLAALAASELPRAYWELIVVDDASTDETASIAARYADTVIRLPGNRHGPAYARNRGFEFARGECVAFVNADVCVHRDTLTRFALVLGGEPDVSAVFGAFDANPPAPGIVSQYRNLLGHYYHVENPGPAETFWASCGAIRRTAFAEAGMYDEWRFARHQIEDHELGSRLRDHGLRIVLRPEIQATHLRRWTIGSMVAADLHDRAVPWMRLFDRRHRRGRRTGVRQRTIKKVNTGLTWLALAFALGAAYGSPSPRMELAGLSLGRTALFLGAALCLLFVLVNNHSQRRFFVRERGLPFALAVIPLDLLSYLVNGVAVVYGWLLREVIGEPTPHPTVEAFAEIGVRMWPPVPSKRVIPEPEAPAAR
jgi:glycosyltransferase involved in cell wall biosynthesis